MPVVLPSGGRAGIRTLVPGLAEKPLSRRPQSSTLAPPQLASYSLVQAEGEGFEPPVHRCTTLFKSAAISHSAIPPGAVRSILPGAKGSIPHAIRRVNGVFSGTDCPVHQVPPVRRAVRWCMITRDGWQSEGGVPYANQTMPTTSASFEPMSKRRKGFPSEAHVKRGDRVVHGDKELIEKLGRNDPCPCRSGKRFQELLHEQRSVSTAATAMTTFRA